MNAPAPARYPLTFGRVLILAAVILLVIAALVFFGAIGGWTLATGLGLVAVGLACYVAASLVP